MYVLDDRKGQWSEQTRLYASDGSAYDYFGISVISTTISLDSDATVVVGAVYDDNHDIEETGMCNGSNNHYL
jgi:hypothetical protein